MTLSETWGVTTLMPQSVKEGNARCDRALLTPATHSFECTLSVGYSSWFIIR